MTVTKAPSEAILRARPTTYNGIKMRSRLEARVAAWFDSLGIEWLYEPCAFASPEGQYLPDFYIDAGRPIYVEVKGKLDMDSLTAEAGRIADIITRSEPDCIIVVATAEGLERGWCLIYNSWLDGLSHVDSLANLMCFDARQPMCHHWRLPEWDA